ncbi:MAG TPA: tetratricopeptide repeat protein [Pyrinomonadaceae bacterium]|jgi:tetratricopeptide (TPR) repeat protein
MKILAVLFFLPIFALMTFGQTPKTTPKRTPKTVKIVAAKLGTEAEEFEKARALPDSPERVAALQNFIKNFPQSTETARAQALIVSTHAVIADKKLEAGDTQAGIELFKLALEEAPTPVSNELFTKVLLGFPLSLYSRSQRAAAFDMVKLIEEKVGANAAQILDLSKFFINVQYGTEAIRLAKKSTELAPDSATGFLTLAIANRLNFQLEDAANAYAKASELDPESVTNKRSLAELKRALGKTDEAIAIYRSMLEKDSTDAAAQSGLTLALFDAGKIKEAEAELAKSLDANPTNPQLLAGAAYWYAAHNDGEKAVEYSQKAIAIDGTSIWSYVAQARGLMMQGKPLEAEKALLRARQYGDFPTLDYELASVRMAAGLYREAAETLKRNFVINKEGAIETYLGNRILADAPGFTELLSLERRVALAEMKAADSEENANRLKALLEFNQKLEAADTPEDALERAADEFTKGGDNMRLHRQLFAASRLLQKKTAPSKVLELMQAAIGGVDAALNVASPSAAVLADEIYDSRQYAITQNLVVVVPEIPRQTLSAILRGRIEDTAGQAFFQQNNSAQSIVRLKRALSVLPEKSAWLRATEWHLGEVLQADGKEKEALESYIKGYNKELPELQKRLFIEALYQKVNGNLDGLDDRIGAKPETAPAVAATENKSTPNNTDNVKTTEPTPAPKIVETPQTIEVKSEPTPKTEETKPATLPENLPAVTPTPDEKPKTEEVKTEENKSPELKPEPSPTTETPTTETPKTDVEPTPSPKASPSPETKIEEVKPEPLPTPDTKTEQVKTEENKPAENKPAETKPEPSPATVPAPQNVSVIITDRLTQIPPSPKVNESKTENKPSEQTTAQKALFDPVIINVGKAEPTKAENNEPKPSEIKQSEEKTKEEQPKEQPIETVQKPEPKPAVEKTVEPVSKPDVVITDPLKPENNRAEKQTEEKPKQDQPIEAVQKNQPDQPEEKRSETVKKPEVIITDLLNPDNKPTEKRAENKSSEKTSDERILSGENRPRIIITENSGAKTVTEEFSTCKLIVAPDSLSLLNGGGSLGVMVGFDGDGDFRQITAASSSADDVEVRLDPEIGASQNRAFFVIKSVTTKRGVFTVVFEAPCGKKEILVKVR